MAATTYKLYAGDGSTRNFAVPFPYLDQSHVTLTINGVVDVAATWVNSALLRASTVPLAGAVVEVRRKTPTNAVPIDFNDGSILSEADLDLLATYAAFLGQESADYLTDAIQPDSTGQFNARALRIRNLAAGVDAGDAVNKAQLDAQQASTVAAIAPYVNSVQASANAATAAAAGVAADALEASNAAAAAAADAASALASRNATEAAAATIAGKEASATAAAATASDAALTAGNAATTATNKANEASASANQAAISASSVGTQASNAANSATAAANSATAAAGSATTASTKAGEASASATAAANSATAAATSASAANVAKINWRGAWSSGATYAARDAVGHLGASYIAIAGSTNVAPPNASYWDLLASKGQDGANGSGTGDVVSTASASVDGEIALFSGTGGKIIKRATGSGLLKMVNGVLGTAVAGVDYIASLAWGDITGKPTTLSGYGITDAQAKDDDLTAIAALAGTTGLLRKTAANTWALDTAAYLTSVAWSGITGKPTTLSGYGITDAQPVDPDLTAIAALVGTSGILRKTAANTWSLDTTAYLTGYTETDPVFAASAAAGVTSGNITNWNAAYGWGNHASAGYLTSVTWANVGGKPTTLAGYGITDAAGLASPAFTGTPTAPTAAQDTATTQLATTAFADRLRDVPANAKTASYTLALTDRGKAIDTTAGVVIPANSAVAFPVGTVISICNTSAASITLSITTDTLRLAGTATTGSRTIAQYGMATIRKVSSTVWLCAGAGVT